MSDEINYRESSLELLDAWRKYNFLHSTRISLVTFAAGFNSRKECMKRELSAVQETIHQLVELAECNPCRCVADGDDGTLAHVCGWHESIINAAKKEAQREILEKLRNKRRNGINTGIFTITDIDSMITDLEKQP